MPAPVSRPLNEQIYRAIDRAARVNDESHALLDECRQVSEALRETVVACRRLRNARAVSRTRRAGRAFGNGPSDARMRSGPG
jgi:hypothetical protein